MLIKPNKVSGDITVFLFLRLDLPERSATIQCHLTWQRYHRRVPSDSCMRTTILVDVLVHKPYNRGKYLADKARCATYDRASLLSRIQYSVLLSPHTRGLGPSTYCVSELHRALLFTRICTRIVPRIPRPQSVMSNRKWYADSQSEQSTNARRQIIFLTH